MSAHVGPVPVEELAILLLGGGAAWAVGVGWIRASAARAARRRPARGRRRSR